MTTTDPTLDALLSLLDDQDEIVYLSVKEKLFSMGPVILPRLEEALLSVDSVDHLKKLEDLISHFKRKMLVEKMKLWLENENRSLLEGWLLVSSIHHSNISREKVEHSIHKIFQDTWLEITESMTSLEKVAVVNHILFRINGFDQAEPDVRRADDLVIDKFLFIKKGDILSLTCLYLIIARNLHLELLPIVLANKLLLVYEDKLAASLAFGTTAEKYLFYINVAHRGSVISPKEVQFLYDKSQKYGKGLTRIETDISLVKRMLILLQMVYTEESDPDRLQITNELISVLDGHE